MDQEPSKPLLGQLKLHSSSLAEQTAQHILDAICDGELQPEDPFPSQYQLSETFAVSRTVIREATQILVSKGILDVQHGKRIKIIPPTHKPISDSVTLTFRRKGVSVLDVLELRKVLEVEAAALAAARRTDADMNAMEMTIRLMEDHLEDERGYIEADVEFHLAIFVASRQPAFELVLTSLNEYMVESRKLSYRGSHPTRRALEAHKRILAAVRAKDQKAARREMQLHLEETEQDLIASTTPPGTKQKGER